VQNGLRGGVHVWMVVPMVASAIPACSVCDNAIVSPLGRALTFLALGPVVVARNRLVTLGRTGRGLDLIAATVLIGNLGLSNEWTLGLIVAMVLKIFGRIGPVADNYCSLAKRLGLFNPQRPPSLWPPLVREWSSGKTLVTQNQITLDIDDEPRSFGISSILVLALDDVGMADNQCEITSTSAFFFVDALLMVGACALRTVVFRRRGSMRHYRLGRSAA